jgi:hypothetical protein
MPDVPVQTGSAEADAAITIAQISAKVYNFLRDLGLFTGATEHLTWDDANKAGNDYADKIIPAILSASENNDTKILKIENELSARIITWYADSGWWDIATSWQMQQDERSDIVNHPDWTPTQRLRNTIWRYHVWVFGNIDSAHLDSANIYLTDIAKAVLVPSLAIVNITKLALPVSYDIPGSSTGTGGVTTTPNATSGIFGTGTTMSAMSWVAIAVMIAILAAMFLYKK